MSAVDVQVLYTLGSPFAQQLFKKGPIQTFKFPRFFGVFQLAGDEKPSTTHSSNIPMLKFVVNWVFQPIPNKIPAVLGVAGICVGFMINHLKSFILTNQPIIAHQEASQGREVAVPGISQGLLQVGKHGEFWWNLLEITGWITETSQKSGAHNLLSLVVDSYL